MAEPLVVTLTPLQARAILSMSPDKSRIRQQQVNLLASAIKRGDWVPAFGVVVLQGERVMDGVQRLAAIAASDQAVAIHLITDASKFVEVDYTP